MGNVLISYDDVGYVYEDGEPMWLSEGGGLVAFFAATDERTAAAIGDGLLRLRGRTRRATFVEESIWLESVAVWHRRAPLAGEKVVRARFLVVFSQ